MRASRLSTKTSPSSTRYRGQPQHAAIDDRRRPHHCHAARPLDRNPNRKRHPGVAYQNVYLGREQLSKKPLARWLNLVDDKAMRHRAREVLDSLAVKIPTINVSVKGTSGGQRQCLAIARAYRFGRRAIHVAFLRGNTRPLTDHSSIYGTSVPATER